VAVGIDAKTPSLILQLEKRKKDRETGGGSAEREGGSKNVPAGPLWQISSDVQERKKSALHQQKKGPVGVTRVYRGGAPSINLSLIVKKKERARSRLVAEKRNDLPVREKRKKRSRCRRDRRQSCQLREGGSPAKLSTFGQGGVRKKKTATKHLRDIPRMPKEHE